MNLNEGEIFAHYWTSGDGAMWGCPRCGSVLGSGIEYCDGMLLDDEDGGDTRHVRVDNPIPENFLSIREERKRAKQEERRFCARRVCRKPLLHPDEWWNTGSRDWYCGECAILINQATPRLCVNITSLPPGV